jgi:hypothetical protein
MSKIWYCPNCGYEVKSRGRCHSCRSRLVASDLPELETGDEDDEVGYRLDDWADRDRGRLIEGLNELEVLHRFEDDELVVAADDEARVDDLIAEISSTPSEAGSYDDGSGVGGDRADADETEDGEDDEWVTSALRLLADAAHRLRQDPTDMNADADVAEASAAVFTVDDFYGADPETWAAVGRVTRRLLSALGDDEALEDQIRSQAGVLYKLLDPLIESFDVAEDQGSMAKNDAAPAATAVDASPSVAEVRGAASPHPDEQEALSAAAAAIIEGGTEKIEKQQSEPGLRDDVDDEVEGLEEEEEEDEDDEGDDESETVYELPDWLPEQRAQLGILLDDADIAYEWEGDDLVVPAERESEVEALFGQVSGPPDEDDDGEDRYRAIEELFAVADRLTNDPSDEQRAAEVVTRIQDVAGPPPLGLDEVAWFRIMTQARVLSDVIEADADQNKIAEEARSLRDLLRGIV